MTQEFEAGVAHQVVDVPTRGGVEVVHTQHLGAVVEQPIAQVAADEAGATGDQHSAPRRCNHDTLVHPVRSAGHPVWSRRAECI